MSDDAVEHTEVVTVLVVDDQRLLRDGIESLLASQQGIMVVGTATNGQDCIEKALSLRPHVILMDIRMPVMDGVAATVRVRQQLPDCRVLVLTTFDDDEYITEALRAGASGYLLKDIPADDLAGAIKAVHRGIYQLDPIVAGKVFSSLGGPTSPTSEGHIRDNQQPNRTTQYGPAYLSNRELEVLRLLAEGANNKEIAERLVIAEGTVKNHISNILSRLGLRDRTQAAIYARDNDLL